MTILAKVDVRGNSPKYIKIHAFRAFGDFSFKSKAGLQAHEQAVCAVPDVKGKIPTKSMLSILYKLYNTILYRLYNLTF